MRLKPSRLNFLINFLLGSAWAVVLLGALFTFFVYIHYSILDAILMTFIGALPGLFLVVILEYMMAGMERLEEVKKQTVILEKLFSELSRTSDRSQES